MLTMAVIGLYSGEPKIPLNKKNQRSYPKDWGFGISTSIPYNTQEMSEMYFMKPARTDSFFENES